jgi:multidrug efflux system outer membrane protein
MRRLFFIAIAASLAGCMVGPDYRRPSVDIPQSFRYGEKDARDTANTEWWKEFGDPVLDGLIAEALASNKDVKVAAANIEKAAGVLTQVRSPLFPQLNYQGDAARQRSSELMATPYPPGVANPFDSFQLFAGATWEIDLWGRIRRLTEAARAELLATREAQRGVILSLVASVAGNYLQLRGLDEQLAISRLNLSAYAESVNIFELQFQYGQVSLMNLEQARTQYETAAANIPKLESQIAQTEHSLSILLGRNPGPIVRGKTNNELAFPVIPAGLPSQLLERRPDLAQAEQNLVSVNAQIGAAKALYFPTISLTGRYGYQSENLSDLFKGPARIWSYGGSISGPIFTAGGISGQVRQAEAAQKAALLSYEKAIQSAFADVENALVDRKKLEEQLNAQKRLVDASSQYERLAKLQYDGGYAPYSTVLQAQQQLFPAELNLAQIRTALLTSFVTIYKAIGGGWVTVAEKLTQPGASSPLQPCAEEFERFCKDVRPGRGMMILCLDQRRDQLSAVCRDKVSGALARIEKARHDCAPDIASFCSGVEPGEGRLLSCLKKKLGKITPTCRDHVGHYAPIPGEQSATAK